MRSLWIASVVLSSTALVQGQVHVTCTGTPTPDLPGHTTYVISVTADDGRHTIGFDGSIFGPMSQSNPLGMPTIFQDNNGLFEHDAAARLDWDSQFLVVTNVAEPNSGAILADASEGDYHLAAEFLIPPVNVPERTAENLAQVVTSGSLHFMGEVTLFQPYLGWAGYDLSPTQWQLTPEAGGAYQIPTGAVLSLDAGGSQCLPGWELQYEWDLDNNGDFETDAGNLAAWDVPPQQLDQLGLSPYQVGGPYPIQLRVTATQGIWTVTMTDDSSLTIVPEPATLGMLALLAVPLMRRRHMFVRCARKGGEHLKALSILIVLSIFTPAVHADLRVECTGQPTPDLPGYATYTVTFIADNGDHVCGGDVTFTGTINQSNPFGMPTVLQDNNPLFALDPNARLDWDSQFLFESYVADPSFGVMAARLSEGTNHLYAAIAMLGVGENPHSGPVCDFARVVASGPVTARGDLIFDLGNKYLYQERLRKMQWYLDAQAGAPYEIRPGSSLALDAGGSQCLPDWSLQYEWDLDNDGDFETDAGHLAAWNVPRNQLAKLGLSPRKTGGPYPIHLRVTATRDIWTVTMTDSSSLTIIPEPTTLSLLALAGLGLIRRRR